MMRKKLGWAVLLLSIGAAPALAGQGPWENSYTLQAHGKYLAALQALDAVPNNGPEAAFKTLRVGWLQYLMGHYDASLAAYRKAAKADPQSLDALLGQTLPLLPAYATLGLTLGEQVYAVNMDAMSVANLADIQRGGLSLGVDWKLGKHADLYMLAAQTRYSNLTLANDYRLDVANLDLLYHW